MQEVRLYSFNLALYEWMDSWGLSQNSFYSCNQFRMAVIFCVVVVLVIKLLNDEIHGFNHINEVAEI